MKQQIIEALIKSTVNQNQVIKAVEQTIKLLSANENYCLALMAIVDDQAIDDKIRLAALIQLKINIERRWIGASSNNLKRLNQNEKTQIKQTLLTAMIRCQHIQPFIRIYRTIAMIVVGYQSKNWMPTEMVVKVLLNEPQNICITIVFIQSVIGAFTEKPNTNKTQLDLFLKPILPLLYQIVTSQKKSIPLIYLVIKTIEKVYKSELTPVMKEHVPHWMPLLKQILDHEQASLSIDNAKDKSSLDSYFFRSKKWAAKIINKFFQTHTSITIDKNNELYARAWLESYSSAFIQSLVGIVGKPNLPKTLFFAMKALAFACNRVATHVAPYSQYLLYTIIPPFVRLVPADEVLANDDPLELLKSEEDVIGIDGKPKSAAINLWSVLVELGYDSGTKKQGPNLKKSLQWIYSILSTQSDLLFKQLAMMLFCRVKYVYMRYEFLKQPIVKMIQNYVVPLLNSDVILIRARAIEVFDYYGDFKFSEDCQKVVVESLYKALSDKDKIILNIKSACAFNNILRHANVLEMVKPYLKQLLQIYIKLISEHQIQNLVASLQGIVDLYGRDIEPFAVDLLIYLSSQFVTFSDGNNNSINTGTDEGEEFQLAASACLDVMKKIVDCSLNQNILKSIQPSIMRVIQQSFTPEGCQYYQGALDLLAIYLFRCDQVSEKVWFFYPCILYNILGLPTQFKDKQIALLNPSQDRILNRIEDLYSKQNMEVSMNVIRAYIYKSSSHALQQKDMFGVAGLQTILKIFEQAYHSNNREPQEVLNSASIFINVFQNSKCLPSMLVVAWQIVKHTLLFVKSVTGKKVAYQLFCLSVLVNPPAMTTILQKQNTPPSDMFKSIIHCEQHFQRQYEITRIILGCSSLFLVERSQGLNEILPNIFKFLVKLIVKLAKVRCKQDQEGDNLNEESFGEDDFEETGCWREDKARIRTHMDRVDAAVFFETSLKAMAEKEPTVVVSLRSLLAPEEEVILNNSLTKAKQKFLEQNLVVKKLTQQI